MTFPFPVFLPQLERVGPVGYAELAGFREIHSVLPVIDAVPQITDGEELLLVRVKPTVPDAKILVRFSLFARKRLFWFGDADSFSEYYEETRQLGVALFRNSTCIHACAQWRRVDDDGSVFSGVILDEPGTTDVVTYSLRIGGDEIEVYDEEIEPPPEFLPNPGVTTVVVNGDDVLGIEEEGGVVIWEGGYRGPLFDGAAKATLLALDLGVPVLQALQVVNSENVSLTTDFPLGAAAPTVSDGNEVLSQSITLSNPNNRVLAMVNLFGHAGGNFWAASLFRGTTCLNAAVNLPSWDDTGSIITMDFLDQPGSVGPHTYSVRVGNLFTPRPRLNGTASGRLFGGAAKSTLTLLEIGG